MMEDRAALLRETAAQHMVRRVPVADPSETLGAVLQRLPGGAYESMDAIYVIDGGGRLQGRVSMRQFLTADIERPIGTLMATEVAVVYPDEDQERVAHIAMERAVPAVAVIDRHRRLLGVVPSRALLKILRAEHIEDLNRLTGIYRRDSEQALNAIQGAPITRVINRLPWLIVGLLGSIAATWLMAGYEEAMQAHLAIAFFIPGLVYLADAVGTQTEAIAVRGLTLSETPVRRLLLGELTTGLLIGLTLGTCIFPLVLWAFKDVELALSVALAVVVAGSSASIIGLLLPWILTRLGKDPAYGSGPVCTILQDLLSLFAYFMIVTLLVL